MVGIIDSGSNERRLRGHRVLHDSATIFVIAGTWLGKKNQ